jgi:uncharacterized coiled-coil protein SlyX
VIEPSQEPDHWVLKKEIQLTHVITTIGVAFAAFMYVNAMEKRLTLIEERVSLQKEQSVSHDKSITETFTHINSQIDKMDAKLDRLIERRK